MLEVEGLHAGYGAVPVLTGISFAVADGGFTGILGHNGMGKTTLLKTLIGLLPATAGRVRLAGDDITRAPCHERARRGMGYVPQGREIFPGALGAATICASRSPPRAAASAPRSSRCWRSFRASSRCSSGPAARSRAASSSCWRSPAAWSRRRA